MTTASGYCFGRSNSLIAATMLWVGVGYGFACSSDDGSTVSSPGAGGSGSGAVCTPGEQRPCDCPGGAKGIQTCNDRGTSLGKCMQCSGGTGAGGSVVGKDGGAGGGSGGAAHGGASGQGGANPTGGSGGSGGCHNLSEGCSSSGECCGSLYCVWSLCCRGTNDPCTAPGDCCGTLTCVSGTCSAAAGGSGGTAGSGGTSNACPSHGGCDSCTGDAQCGWCDTTYDCLEGDSTGPTGGYCSDWRYLASECETTANCSSYGMCSSCSGAPGCGWCGDLNACIPGDSDGPSSGICANWNYLSSDCTSTGCFAAVDGTSSCSSPYPFYCSSTHSCWDGVVDCHGVKDCDSDGQIDSGCNCVSWVDCSAPASERCVHD